MIEADLELTMRGVSDGELYRKLLRAVDSDDRKFELFGHLWWVVSVEETVKRPEYSTHFEVELLSIAEVERKFTLRSHIDG